MLSHKGDYGYIEDYRPVLIKTLERESGKTIRWWIAEHNGDNEPVRIERANRRYQPRVSIWIGGCDYMPARWKCPGCGRWNFELIYMDPTGASFTCGYCYIDGEF
ncbi:MAG: hypothetical protein ACYTEQ_24890 [Planctomycetota bacterium]